MSRLFRNLDTLMSFPRIKYKPFKPRIDADPSLIRYHDPSTGAKPAPSQTNTLPLRTRIHANMFAPISYAQTHSYYEEIDSIPAEAVDVENGFSGSVGRHWYVVHPLSSLDVLEYNTRVLLDLKECVEVKMPGELFVGEHAHVVGFKDARRETVDALDYELEKRESEGGGDGEAGYTGMWEMTEGEWKGNTDVDDEVIEEDGTGEGAEKESGSHTQAALEEAEATGREAAEEARLLDGFDIVY